MAQLRRQQGRIEDAAELFCSVYDRFSEGFETLGLKTTRTLLDDLRTAEVT